MSQVLVVVPPYSRNRGSSMATSDGTNGERLRWASSVWRLARYAPLTLRFFVSLLRSYRQFISVPQSRAEQQYEWRRRR